MLGDGGDRDRAAYRLGPRDGKLHKANRRFHEKTRQIDRIADRHGLHEEKLEERRGEFGMKLAGCFARESTADGRVLEATSEPKDQSTKRLVLPVPPDAEILRLAPWWALVSPTQAAESPRPRQAAGPPSSHTAALGSRPPQRKQRPSLWTERCEAGSRPARACSIPDRAPNPAAPRPFPRSEGAGPLEAYRSTRFRFRPHRSPSPR